ncbi:NFACT RNA binding domain-containing protein [Polyangium aurulentum]|uniref:NFACT RNA binding domain-containing protein n=1 Tax=Polyangium aurulentum TaxID=2567896 RepID=UPI001F2F4A61|nr:NFACT RNA binding domain-containing protein [Polyangium aurulentum]
MADDLNKSDNSDLHHPLLSALAPLLGARIEAAHLCPETGLLALAAYAGQRIILGAGLGPHATGLGLLPRVPRSRAPSSHPLVAAMRAHLVDRRVASLFVSPDGALCLLAGSEDGATARLSLHIGRKGRACVVAPSGATISWPVGAEADPSPTPIERFTSSISSTDDLANLGAALLEASDRRALESRRAFLLRTVKMRLKALERRAEAVGGDLARLDDAPRLQKIGRLLTAQASRIPRGAARATLDDWEEGGSIEISLDPDKPAKAQAETFFAKARRLQRGAAVMRQRLDETLRAAALLPPIADAIASAPLEPAALDALATRARAAGVAIADSPSASSASAKPTRRDPQERRPFHTFHGSGGKPILVGRGGKDNDALITKFARPHDLWLHAKNIHGAHVIVPLEKGANPPADLLVDAATLAAHFSDARGESACEVSYVERRHVRKPRKSAPGAVTFDREKVITVRVEPARLARLLSSKEET